jgi:isoquinoline 1-oxidoreductase beta subunit
MYRAKINQSRPAAVDEGDADAVFGARAKIVEAEYVLPHQAHAQMEPAELHRAGHGRSRRSVARHASARCRAADGGEDHQASSRRNVYVHNCFEGGGFGMGGCHGELEQAVTIAKALNGRPVKVLWSREEDLAHVNGYHPMGVAKLTAALGRRRHAARAPHPRRGQRRAGIHAGAGDDPGYVPGELR